MHLYAFFENAFHLRDWLQDTGAATALDLQAFFYAHEDMRLCRDLANSHKQYSIGLSMDSHSSVSFPMAIQATGRLTVALVGFEFSH